MKVTSVAESGPPLLKIAPPAPHPPSLVGNSAIGVAADPPTAELSVNCERASVIAEFSAKIAPPSPPLACWSMLLPAPAAVLEVNAESSIETVLSYAATAPPVPYCADDEPDSAGPAAVAVLPVKVDPQISRVTPSARMAPPVVARDGSPGATPLAKVKLSSAIEVPGWSRSMIRERPLASRVCPVPSILTETLMSNAPSVRTSFA